MRILQVSSEDQDGGAERVARTLFEGFIRRGHESMLAVGRKRSSHPMVFEVENDAWRGGLAGVAARFLRPLGPLGRRWPKVEALRRRLALYLDPQRLRNYLRGFEDFEFPGTAHLLKMCSGFPYILHCHNLHGAYFDLRALPSLSDQTHVVLTLHDSWLLTGHCADGLDCEKWRTGCGSCPDLRLYPAVRRDETAFNWDRKREIYSHSRLYVATPSRWLMDRVEHSMLAPGVEQKRVIPNGVDISVFKPGNKRESRQKLGLPQDAIVLLFAANGIRQNPWKDFVTLRRALPSIQARLPNRQLLFLALGESSPPERIGGAELRFVPYQSEPEKVAAFYQAADVYLHAAKVEVWGLTITEAMACGTPVVATAVGGIPEQVEHEKCGLLVEAGDSAGIARAVERLISDPSLQQRLGEEGSERVARRFSLERQISSYLEWYGEILEAACDNSGGPVLRFPVCSAS